MTKVSNEVREKAAQHLRQYFKPGDTAFTMLLHVSSSGMSRQIAVMAAERREVYGTKRKQIVPVNVSWLVSDALGWRMNKGCTGLVVGGCGMDMGFHTVYELASVLYNGMGTEGKPVTNGRGYALRHSWL